MSFWNNTTASPSVWQTLWLADKTPRYLRPGPPRPVPNFWTGPSGVVGTLVRLFGTDADRVSEFLTMYYRGPDWHMGRVSSWIGSYLRDADVIAIGVEDNDHHLMGVIFSTPFTTSNTIMSHGANLQNVRVIEGLAVATPFRSAGLAGYLIAQADAFTHRIHGRAVHLWSREVQMPAAFSTAITSDLYGYRRGGAVVASTPRIISWDSFTELWRRHAWRWPAVEGVEPCIIGLTPSNRRGGLVVYAVGERLTVVSRTDRVSGGGEHIYEIVWCGRLVEGVLLPPPADVSFKPLLDAVAESLPSDTILFGTTAPTGGGLRQAWDGWTVGRSGAHEWNLYNYVAPAYGSCRIYAIREEL